jgi:hypothetical protein
MLRAALLIIAGVALAIGAMGIASGAGFGWPFLFWGAILAAGVLYERFRYKPLSRTAPGPEWEKTAERFVDDETGRTVTVYMRKDTGERQYVED